MATNTLQPADSASTPGFGEPHGVEDFKLESFTSALLTKRGVLEQMLPVFTANNERNGSARYSMAFCQRGLCGTRCLAPESADFNYVRSCQDRAAMVLASGDAFGMQACAASVPSGKLLGVSFGHVPVAARYSFRVQAQAMFISTGESFWVPAGETPLAASRAVLGNSISHVLSPCPKEKVRSTHAMARVAAVAYVKTMWDFPVRQHVGITVRSNYLSVETKLAVSSAPEPTRPEPAARLVMDNRNFSPEAGLIGSRILRIHGALVKCCDRAWLGLIASGQARSLSGACWVYV